MLQLPLTILGWFVVPLAIPFRVKFPETEQPYTQYPELGNYMKECLPTWALLWDNRFDGIVTDKRGWFTNWCRERHIGAFLQRYIWTAWRNPTNYCGRVILGIDVSKCVIELKAGQPEVEADQGKPGWQYLVATNDLGITYPRFFAEIILPFAKGHILLIDIGWKIKLSHNNTPLDARPQDRYKGHVFTISPWKSL